jgi:hypothetical protein
MTWRKTDLWRRAVAVVPALLLLVCLPGETMLRCRVDGLLRSTCCCAHQGERQTSGPAVSARECCDPEVNANVRPVAEAAAPAEQGLTFTAAAAVPVAPIAFVAPPVERWGSTQGGGPAGVGPPLVLLKSSLLI